MKSLFAFATLFGLLISPVMAGELAFPKTGEPMFTITVPNNWEVDSDEDDVVVATSPEEHLSLSIWEIDSDTKVETVVNDLGDILKDYAKDVKVDGEPKKIEVEGLPALFITGLGQDPDDDTEVGFIAFVLVKGEKAAIVFFEMDSNITEKELHKFEGILKSLKVPSTEDADEAE